MTVAFDADFADFADFAAFIEPWRAVFPALALAEVFASVDEQPNLLARSIWVMETADSLWKVSDATIGSAKLGWWHEEWQRAAQLAGGAHPLSASMGITGSASPMAAFLSELEDSAPANSEWRWRRYQQLATALTKAFSAHADRATTDMDPAAVLLWTALLCSRHLAALWQGATLAVAALPLDLRADLQLATDAPPADLARRAAQRHADLLVLRLHCEWQRLPASAWRGRRGARVLTHLALREMLRMGAPITHWSRTVQALAAWRAARGVD